MYDMYKGNDCGCSSRPEHNHKHDDKKDKACDFDSTFLGNGLVRQRETIRITAIDLDRTVYLADGDGSTNAKVKIKNLSSRNPIDVTIIRTGFPDITIRVEPNGELLISSFVLQRIDIRTTNPNTTANVLLCFELLVCNADCSGFGPVLTTDVNPDSQEENI